jgi:hypothetical protein
MLWINSCTDLVQCVLFFLTPITASLLLRNPVSAGVFVTATVLRETVDETPCSRLRLKCDGTRAETRFRLSAKRTSPFKSAGASVHSSTCSRGVRISGSNAGYTMFRGSMRVLATHSIRQFPLHFPSRASPCAITFQLDSTTNYGLDLSYFINIYSLTWVSNAVCYLFNFAD